MIPVIVDGDGMYVGIAYHGTVLADGEQIIEVSPLDLARLVSREYRWESTQAVIGQNKNWRNSTRAAQVLAMGNGQDLTGNLLRNIVQDLIRQSHRQARQLNAIWRQQKGTIEPIGDDS